MNEIIALLEKEIKDVELDYQFMGSKLMLQVVSPVFKGMSRVERQRYVKRILFPFIESGELHAVSLKIGVKDECE